MNKLEQLRARLADLENKNSGNNNNAGSGDSTLYPHWNIDDDTSALVRFLPDDDPDNVFFWVERQVIKLKFPGVAGQAEQKEIVVQVPCGEMYGDTCPVLTEVRPWFKDPKLEDMARSYWKKRSYIFQGFVVDNPMKEDNPPESPIRRFIMSPQIFKIIKSALMDPEMEDLPTDYKNGLDFRISKTKDGTYANYTTSKWARKERGLTDDELAAIDTHGLFDLKAFLPARPTAEHYAAIAEMFEASVNGELYDPERWGNYYKPYGLDVPESAAKPNVQQTSAPAQKVAEQVAAKADQVEQDDIPFDEPSKEEPKAEPAKAKPEINDILSTIRNRATNKE